MKRVYMSEIQHHQQHQQWAEYFELIKTLDGSRSDAVQLIGEIQKLTNGDANEKNSRIDVISQ